MEAIHNINFGGFRFSSQRKYDNPDHTTGYKGGFSYHGIFINDVEWSWFISKDAIERIVELVIDENY